MDNIQTPIKTPEGLLSKVTQLSNSRLSRAGATGESTFDKSHLQKLLSILPLEDEPSRCLGDLGGGCGGGSSQGGLQNVYPGHDGLCS